MTISLMRAAGAAAMAGRRRVLSPYTPLDESSLLEWWAADDLANGAVASWLGRKGVATFVQASGAVQPTKSATAITAPDATQYPGVTFSGAKNLATADLGASIDLLDKITAIISAVGTNTGTTLRMIMEYTSNALSGSGGFFLAVNDGVADVLEMGARGGAGNGVWRSTAGMVTLSDPAVVTAKWDLGIASAKSVLQLDGVDLTGAAVASACAGGTWPSSTLNLGSRNGTASFWTGSVRDVVLLNGTDDAAARYRVASFVGPRVGVTV